jgi:hypothetical protein
MRLEGSCHCGAVRFRVESHTPYPYMRCYCSICRKTQGGGGYAVNTTLQDEFSALGLCFRHRDFCIAATHCSIDEAARSP